jgi:hypothetical protein
MEPVLAGIPITAIATIAAGLVGALAVSALPGSPAASVRAHRRDA